MNIQLNFITIKDLVEAYSDKSLSEEGITGWSGNLDIRPKYQREFIYDDDQRKEVIRTIIKGFPLSTMYWVKKDNEEDKYEILDGQQRTISICQYVNGQFSILDHNNNPRAFYNLSDEEKETILNYKLMVYFCEGTTNEKLDWFKIINIAGEKLTDQELRNAVYTGSWLSDAKKKFSKTNCVAYNLGNSYLKGTPIRQEYLETALAWISNNHIKDYMAAHQNDQDANELWQYFQRVISWVQMLFPNYRRDMKGIDWGYLYNKYKDKTYNTESLTRRYQELVQDEEVESRSTRGIYYYLLSGEERHLNLRTFDEKHKIIAFNRQQGKCTKCNLQCSTIEQMQADHIVAWSNGGKTIQENCQMLCIRCNNTKSNN